MALRLPYVGKRRFRKRATRRVSVHTFYYQLPSNIFLSIDDRKYRTRSGEAAWRVILFLYVTLNSLYYHRSEVLDNVNPDLSESDSEFIEQEAPTPAMADMADAPTPGGDIGDGDSLVRTWEPEENDEPEGDPDGFIDKELAAELDLAHDVDESKDGRLLTYLCIFYITFTIRWIHGVLSLNWLGHLKSSLIE